MSTWTRSSGCLVLVADRLLPAAAYLEAAIEEAGDDPAFIAHALGTVARSETSANWRAESA